MSLSKKLADSSSNSGIEIDDNFDIFLQKKTTSAMLFSPLKV
jgi:hypothetical protein